MLLRMWDESWDKGLWAASWSGAVAGLSAAQAAWKPAGGGQRHSIWQNVNHVSMWREVTLSKQGLFAARDQAEVERLNFEEPAAISEPAWEAARSRLKRSHDALRGLIADSSKDPQRAYYHLTHDQYHLGQVMLLRAMQGLPPLE
jgi:hypothetical protein